MHRFLLPPDDPQACCPTTYCCFCGAALYDSDVFYSVNGREICEACLPTLAREAFASFRLSGREWRHQ